MMNLLHSVVSRLQWAGSRMKHLWFTKLIFTRTPTLTLTQDWPRCRSHAQPLWHPLWIAFIRFENPQTKKKQYRSVLSVSSVLKKTCEASKSYALINSNSPNSTAYSNSWYSGYSGRLLCFAPSIGIRVMAGIRSRNISLCLNGMSLSRVPWMI